MLYCVKELVIIVVKFDFWVLLGNFWAHGGQSALCSFNILTYFIAPYQALLVNFDGRILILAHITFDVKSQRKSKLDILSRQNALNSQGRQNSVTTCLQICQTSQVPLNMDRYYSYFRQEHKLDADPISTFIAVRHIWSIIHQ